MCFYFEMHLLLLMKYIFTFVPILLLQKPSEIVRMSIFTPILQRQHWRGSDNCVI